MAISSQAAQKCAEGSETRLYGLTVLCANSSVEYKDHESPRAPGNQEVQQMRSRKTAYGVLWNEVAMQEMSACDMRGIQEAESAEDQAHVASLVREKSGPCFSTMQEIQC